MILWGFWVQWVEIHFQRPLPDMYWRGTSHLFLRDSLVWHMTFFGGNDSPKKTFF